MLLFFFLFFRLASSTTPLVHVLLQGRPFVERQPTVVVARDALPEILLRSRRAELHSRWSRGVNAGSNGARRGTAHLAGMRFCLSRI